MKTKKVKTLLNYLLRKQWILRIIIRFLSKDKKEQIYIARFRAELLFWGHNTSELTDDEIKEGINKMGELVTKCGFTIEEINRAMQVVAFPPNV